jgi:hypothetical protein
MSAALPISVQNTKSSARLLSFDRFLQKCAHAACQQRGKVWPGWLRRPEGAEFQSRWYCSPACVGEAAESEFLRLFQEFRPEKRKAHRIPLGLLLVSRGAITSEQLREAVQLQQEARQGKLGFWLRQIGAINEADLVTALGMQWGCPVFPLERHHAYLQCGALVPFPLLEAARVLPVHFAPGNKLLYLAFADRIDHSLLYAVEQMLGCHTAPSVAGESAVGEALEHIHRAAGQAEETVFDSLRDPREMARTTCNYATKLQSKAFRAVRAANYIWVRFESCGVARDLLFQLQPADTAHSLLESHLSLQYRPGYTKVRPRPADKPL